MSKEEFVRRWRFHLAGLALFGAYSDQRDGILARAAKVWDVPAEVEKLLGLLWQDAQPKEIKPANGTNGVPQPQLRKT